MNTENIEQENVTVSPVTDFESTIRTNRTNRLEVLDEYYGNSTNDDQFETTTTVVELKELVMLFANTTANEDFNRTNITIVEEIGKIYIDNK